MFHFSPLTHNLSLAGFFYPVSLYSCVSLLGRSSKVVCIQGSGIPAIQLVLHRSPQFPVVAVLFLLLPRTPDLLLFFQIPSALHGRTHHGGIMTDVVAHKVNI